MRLDFFKDFILSTGVSFNDVAERLGISSSALWLWFHPKNDDVKLSIIGKVADVTGYTMHVTIVKRADALVSGRNPELESSFRYVNGKLVDNPLSFLSMFLDRYGITKTELSKKMNYPWTTLLYWFREGDILVSKLMEIAQAYDAVLSFTFEKALKDDEIGKIPTSDGPSLITKTTTYKTY